jgi:hypothetical protein
MASLKALMARALDLNVLAFTPGNVENAVSVMTLYVKTSGM